MKTRFLIKSCFVVCVFVLSTSAYGDAMPESEHSMTGCLESGAEAGTFRLTNLGLVDGPEVVEIAEATTDLGPHVGHKVEITGSSVDGEDPATHTMKVTAMKHLAATCP